MFASPFTAMAFAFADSADVKASTASRLASTCLFDKDNPYVVIKKHPDLAPAYSIVDAAKKFAELNLPTEWREKFVGLAY